MRRLILVVGLLIACGPTAVSHSPIEGPNIATPSVVGPQPTPSVPAVPVRLRIPSLKVDSPIQPVGLMPDGSVGTPCDPAKSYAPCNTNATAWYKESVRPGAPGQAVIDGHVDWYGPAGSNRDIPAVFANLHKAHIGALVIVIDKKGVVRTFVVDRITQLPYPKQPSHTYDWGGPAGLTLITCAGVFVNASTGGSERLYVHASLK